MCICLSVAVNVGGVLEVRVCLRTDNCHSHFGKIKIMRCLCVCPEEKNRSQLLQHQCATHTRFCLRLDFPILRSKEVPQIYGIFLILIFHQDNDILDVRKMFKQNDSTRVHSFFKQRLHQESSIYENKVLFTKPIQASPC